jgi:hypothetical protein
MKSLQLALNKEPKLKNFNTQNTFTIIYNNTEFNFYLKDKEFKLEWCNVITDIIKNSHNKNKYLQKSNKKN